MKYLEVVRLTVSRLIYTITENDCQKYFLLGFWGEKCCTNLSAVCEPQFCCYTPFARGHGISRVNPIFFHKVTVSQAHTKSVKRIVLKTDVC